MNNFLIPIKLAFKSLRNNVGRTILSLLGIVIGVVSVILVLSFGSGVKGFLVDQVSAFGSDIMEIEIKVPKVSKTSTQNASGQAGGTQITTFKLEDAEKVAKLPNVGAWYAAIMNQQIIKYENKNKQVYIMGTTAGVAEADKKMEIEKGIMFNEDDDNSLRQIAILGSGVKKDFFGESEAVGKEIKIKGQTYKVIGVLKERGAVGPFNFDEVVYVPLQTVQKKLAGIDYIQFAIFKLDDMKKLDLTILNATDVMRTQHDITDPNDDDFAVNSIVEVLEILNKVFFSVNLLLIALTSISLIVGGVGIMNVMYVTVTERTFEIGLKKSIGAKNSQILFQFLFEAIFITLLGGIVGFLIGFGISKLGEIVAVNFGFNLKFPITWWSASIGLGFSALTGIIFGYYPARKASLLSPMEALRKE
ncbi:MAG TPA: ABC transporter permease [Candidatus Moranbacteria bacterium]|nr:ABC transporter permease [Candidatus Moranbacteria bacterium]